MRRLWNAISRLGVGAQPPDEQRRIRLGNQSAILAIVVHAGYAVGYISYGWRFWPLALSSLIALLVAAVCLRLSASGWTRAARILLLAVLNAQILVAALGLGRSAGVQMYLLLFAAAALLFRPMPLRFAWMPAALSLGLFVYLQYFTDDKTALIPLCGSSPAWIHASSTLLTALILLFVLSLFQNASNRAEKALAAAHDRSERLLLNVLPASISERLKAGEEPIADGLREVTVLFADLVGFTELSSRLQPSELVALLNRVFTAFDALSAAHGVEKIKTIGDAYMVAAGVPEARADHASTATRLAVAMLRAVDEISAAAGHTLSLRIGLHSGPVVAGVIGKRKFSYDLWGDTVNIASRMESHGSPGRIHISAQTRALLGDEFSVESRGAIAVKGKGQMETFFVG